MGHTAGIDAVGPRRELNSGRPARKLYRPLNTVGDPLNGSGYKHADERNRCDHPLGVHFQLKLRTSHVELIQSVLLSKLKVARQGNVCIFLSSFYLV
jgi:hypothetical protein